MSGTDKSKRGEMKNVLFVCTHNAAHELRLQKILPRPIDEFDGERSPQEIRECAELEAVR